MRLGRLIAAACLLAACGSSTSKTDLPAGQHDVGDHVAVIVHEVRPVGDVVAVDLEWFNSGKAPVDMTAGYAVELHDSNGYEATLVTLPDGGADAMPGPGRTIPAGSSVRGWEGFQVANGAKPAELLLYGHAPDTDPTVVKL